MSTPIVCEICEEEVNDEDYIGCCKDGQCEDHVESMCNTCGTWDKEKEVWLCPNCVETMK